MAVERTDKPFVCHGKLIVFIKGNMKKTEEISKF